MTVLIKHYANDKYIVNMEWDKSNVYVVGVYPIVSDNMVGYPIRQQTYAANKKANAVATFNRYKKQYGGI